jgi:branched-chain amino acid transport system substrate-binding protein
MKNSSTVCFLALCRWLGWAVAATISFSAASAAPARIKVGVILPLSGEFAVLGAACRNGALLAASELTHSGIDLDLRIEDSPSSAATSTLSAYHKLRTFDKVSLFFGFVSPEELAAVGPIAERDGAALVAFTPSKRVPKNCLLAWMNPDIEAQRLAAEVYRKHQDVAILSADQQWERDFSEAFSAAFTALGGKISLRLEAPSTSKNLSSEVLRLRTSTATAVLIPPYSLFSSYAKALKRNGIKLPIYGVELDQTAIDDSQGGAEGAIIIRPADPNGAFNRKYTDFFGGLPVDIPASQCYDGIKIIGDAVKSGAVSGNDFGKYFSELASFSGASGPIVFEAGKTIFTTELLLVFRGLLTKTGDNASLARR